ncbi:MAG: hypothetical protein IT519_04165 [Burkholderiales bacterium]|jgi:hypothetical protein|nr:hypothetical protein [Burkholderiales bacterium]
MIKPAMMRLPNLFRLFAMLVLLTVATGCAGPAPSPASLPNEGLLSAAGFKTIAADTPQRKRHLESLPPDQVTAVQLTGKHYYVFPDVTKSRLFVGTPKEYQAYLALRTRNGLPNPPPQDWGAAKLDRTLEAQDQKMANINTQDASIPSWAIWPPFGGLGWVP